MLSFLFKYRPFRSTINNFVEIVNEVTFITLVYISLGFNDLYEKAEFKIFLGWIFIGVIVLNTAINFIIILIELIKGIISFMKKIYSKFKNRKNKVQVLKTD